MVLKSISKAVVLAGVMALAVLLTGRAMPASAVITSLTVNGVVTTPQTFALGTNIPVVATYTDEGSATLVLTSSNPGVAYFNAFGPATLAPLNGETILPVTPSGTITVTDDADAISVAKTLTANLFCAANGTANISYTQGAGTPTPTSATIVVNCGTGVGTTITFSSGTTAAVGTPITVTAACTGALQGLTASSGNFSPPTTNGTYVSTTLVNCIAAGPMTVIYTCTVAGTITFTLNGVTATLTCTGTTTTTGLVVSPTTGMTGTVTGTCPGAGSLLTQTGPATFTGTATNGTVTSGGQVTCIAAGTIIATFTCNTTGTVYLALGALTGTFYCSTTGYYGGIYGGAYNPYLNAYPNGCVNGAYNGAYNTGVYPYSYANQYTTTGCYNQQQYTNVPTTLTITAGSASVACGGTSSVTVRVMGANGQTVTDGTAVALAASVGTLSPASATTTAGAVTATYTAPANVPATSVTLRATAGAASNTTGVSVTCATTTAPATTAPVQAPTYSPPAPPAGLVISPPNTGDGGLLVAEMTNCSDVAS
jgi:hypothetical protein